MPNPYLICHDGIWDLVDNFAPLAAEFKKGNVINLNDLERSDPQKDRVLNADLPEIVLVMGGGVGNLHKNSSISEIVQQWDFLISTGERRLTLISDLKWYTYQAIWNWKQTLGGALYGGESFVVRCDWLNVVEGESDPERNRGIVGWSTVISLETEFNFSRAQMQYTE